MFEVFWIIPPLLDDAYLQSTFFIWRIFSGLSGVGATLSHTGLSALGWPLGGVRVWKLSRTYPGEKPPPFSLPMQGCWFVTRKPTRHLPAIPNILVGMGALYEDPMIHSVSPALDQGRHLSQKINIYIKLCLLSYWNYIINI